MRFTYIDELKTVLTNELKESNLNEKALDEITNKGVHGIDDVLKHKESELLEV